MKLQKNLTWYDIKRKLTLLDPRKHRKIQKKLDFKKENKTQIPRRMDLPKLLGIERNQSGRSSTERN
jgi:hypothetical protein